MKRLNSAFTEMGVGIINNKLCLREKKNNSLTNYLKRNESCIFIIKI